jgi:hypothetical protein
MNATIRHDRSALLLLASVLLLMACRTIISGTQAIRYQEDSDGNRAKSADAIVPISTSPQKPAAFLEYANDSKVDYQNVLILGVDAKSDRQFDLLSKYSFNKVIPISREGGRAVEDWVRAAIEKLGFKTGSLDELKGKTIGNLYAQSWGSSRVINQLYTGTLKTHNLHLLGSPHSIVFSSLNESLKEHHVEKVYFHINEDDKIAGLRNLPSWLTGRFDRSVEVHFYSTAHQSEDSVRVNPFEIPLFNAPVGNQMIVHYNSPFNDHGIENYFGNFSFVMNRDRASSPFKPDAPFFTVPIYWTESGRDQSMTEASILTGMVNGKKKAAVVGKGPEAEAMYQGVMQKLGKINVLRVDAEFVSESKALERQVKNFGADVVLAVKRPNLNNAAAASETAGGITGGNRKDKDSGNISSRSTLPSPVGGVKVDLDVSASSFTPASNLSPLRSKLLRARTSTNELTWPIP